MRSGGAQFASAAGCTEDAIRKHGRWCGDRLMERYLTTVTLQPIRALSGFGVAGGDYWIPRSQIEPPSQLAELIFPWVDTKHSEVQKRAEGGGEADCAALQFLDMLKFLRTVLLQDSAVLQKLHPSLPLWNRAPFNTATFTNFAAKLNQELSSAVCPFDVAVSQVIPALGNALGDVRSELSVVKEADESRLNVARSAVADALAALAAVSSQLSTTTSTPRSLLLNTISSSPTAAASFSSLLVGAPSSGSPAAADSPALSSLSSSTDSPTTSGTSFLAPTLPSALPAATAAAAAAASALGTPASYQLPDLTTVKTLWKEWTEGGEGRAALSEMDAAKDCRLRTSSKVKQQVYRWRKVVSFVKEREEGGDSVEDTVVHLVHLLKQRKGGLRLLAEELAAADKRTKWAQLLADKSSSSSISGTTTTS
ncbi:hypothetical protein A4X09_0g2637 [Tilletia walkeri]|uniref:Ndc10 domain-containing protein n=1 Tax=Tilletia walkeri TaxID=117179 RepID=A0A8X7T5N2_9BASI|nr:hypothetical protein A4X09_0g2637 [Tilletia walkeri]